jgi:hypothetical protein
VPTTTTVAVAVLRARLLNGRTRALISIRSNRGKGQRWYR